MLEPTRVRPNAVTLAAAALMLAAAGIVGASPDPDPMPGLASAMALAAALVLDTADGRLARLQGTGSDFGRWLDHVLDELGDMALHAAIAWSVFQSTGRPAWLVLGMLYASGKYLFVVQSLAGEAIETGSVDRRARDDRPAPEPAPRRSTPSDGCVGLAGHADVRWHLWIVLAAFGRLDLALVAYAAYFPLRALGGGLRKAVAHA